MTTNKINTNTSLTNQLLGSSDSFICVNIPLIMNAPQTTDSKKIKVRINIDKLSPENPAAIWNH